MIIENKDDYINIKISSLGLSTRTFNALMRANITTLYDVIKNIDSLYKVRNLGEKCIDEISDAINNLSQEKIQQKANVTSSDYNSRILSEEILMRPVTDLRLGNRVFHCLENNKIKTIAQLLEYEAEDLKHFEGMGVLSLKQLMKEIELLNENKEDYFVSVELEEQDLKVNNKREIDIETVKKLKSKYGLKTSLLCEWYDVTRQCISPKLEKRTNKGCWCGKELTLGERKNITEMLNKKVFYLENDMVKYYILNNMKDDCAFVIVSDDDIKCFYLNEIPVALAALCRMEKMDCLTEEEQNLLVNKGKKISILKKNHIIPDDMKIFNKLAKKRNMSLDEYSQFIYCYSLFYILPILPISSKLKEGTV